jgi:GT2 family glycosyltransferase
MTAPSDVTVAICTYRRADVLRTCLEHVAALDSKPFEVIVVDASPDLESKAVVEEFPGARYVRNDSGLGTLPRSRKIALAETSSPVIAFIDDDAFPEPQWLDALAGGFLPGVGGVTGRSRNGQPGEESIEGDVGVIRSGRVIGNFATAVVPAREVEHVIGCNMAFLREALEAAGGMPEWHAGVSAVGEDLMLSLLVRRAGWKLRFVPEAVVLHIGAPQAKGRRFDLRYQFVAARNYAFVFAAVEGVRSGHLRSMVHRSLVDAGRDIAKSAANSLWRQAGIATGLWRAIGIGRMQRSRSRGQRQGSIGP